jgi:hypothetical protein
MSRFLSTAPHPLTFSLGGKPYQVPVGGEVEIPARVAFAIKQRGLPLVPVQGSVDDAPPAILVAPESDDAPPKERVALLWYTRAHEERAELVRHHEKLTAAQELVDQVEDAAKDFSSDLRRHLGILDEDSIIEAIDKLLAERDAASRSHAAALTEREQFLARIATLEEAMTAPAPQVPATATAPKAAPSIARKTAPSSDHTT